MLKYIDKNFGNHVHRKSLCLNFLKAGRHILANISSDPLSYIENLIICQ